MTLVPTKAWIALLSLISFSATASDLGDPFSSQSSKNSETLISDLENLGAFLGYNIKDKPKNPPPEDQSQPALLDESSMELIQNYVYNTLFGALPVNSISKDLSQFVPNTEKGSEIINASANKTYTDSGNSASVTPWFINRSIDQAPNQTDPVNQAVLNILGTANYTFCMLNNSWVNNCNVLYQEKVTASVLGPIPTSSDAFSPEYNNKIIGQLNANSLMGPLLYSTESTENPNSNAPQSNNGSQGLSAQTQIEEAQNFIRYATGAITPTNIPQKETYEKLFNQAYPTSSNTVEPSKQLQAQSTLRNYLSSLRIFAAQSSVGIGNLYYILSRRLPQNVGVDANTSQALSEFKMASWRLYKPDLSPNDQWIKKINEASSPTVQKEIAVLLAEMNYQLYLNRQLEERLLLTQSIQLIQNTRASEPDTNFSNADTNEE